GTVRMPPAHPDLPGPLMVRATNVTSLPMRSRESKWGSTNVLPKTGTFRKLVPEKGVGSNVMYGLYGSVNACAEVTVPLVEEKTNWPRTLTPALVPPTGMLLCKRVAIVSFSLVPFQRLM